MREAFARLVEIVATLRSPDGCPWDREQTIDSLKPYVLEETYEVLDAIDRGDHAALREELGDFVFEAVFLAQLESEAGHFSIAPHVFARQDGHAPINTAGEVVTKWEEIKAQERGGASKPRTLLGTVPAALPALLRAYQIGLRAHAVGFDWQRPADVVDKIQEEVDEIREAVASDPASRRVRVEDEMGDLLFSIANLSRQLGVDPETALRKANDKFTRRFEAMERHIEASGRKMADMSLVELEREWQRAKSGQQAG